MLQSPIGRVASRPMRNIETFPSKHMYLYLSLVERKVAEFYHNMVKMTYFHRFLQTIDGVLGTQLKNFSSYNSIKDMCRGAGLILINQHTCHMCSKSECFCQECAHLSAQDVLNHLTVKVGVSNVLKALMVFLSLSYWKDNCGWE